jgi:SAM-dependent methyltransferase
MIVFMRGMRGMRMPVVMVVIPLLARTVRREHAAGWRGWSKSTWVATASNLTSMTGLPAAEVFNTIALEYETAYASIAARREETEWLIAQLPAGAAVADIGCGTGRPVVELLAAAELDVTGYDVSPRMVELARTNVPRARFEIADVRTLSLPDGGLHAVTAFFSLLQVSRPELDAALATCATWLKPGGYFVLGAVPADIENVDIVFLGQPVTVSSYPTEDYRMRLRDIGLEVIRERTETFRPDYAGAEPEDNLFIIARKPLTVSSP